MCSSDLMGATILKTEPLPMPEQPLQPTAITLEGLVEQAERQAAAPQPPSIIEGELATPQPPPVVAQAPAPAPAAPTPQPAAQTARVEPVVRDQYGLPVPTTEAPKGKSPFDTDPGAKVPASAPDRILRDIVAMAPQLFATPAAVIVKGDGKGVPQRTRAFMAMLALMDQALASAPDDTTPVGYLRHYIAHLRYHASQSAAAPAMAAFEQYVFQPRSE